MSASAAASGDRQNLWDAIDNPAGDAAIARRAEDTRHRQAQAAESEARRPVCTGCGTKFTDDRWKAGVAVDWGRGVQPPAPVRRLQDPGF
ncbi:hypothetical protein [Streptomyces sp. NPDC050121]|uniref:hypothetical protein n=1 Tax=Streptomyces sp. NPDC050121 TaxID=3365601 RepID=UPI0037988F8A